jgi:hypothetical protein
MASMTFWFIRHKTTGKYFPEPVGRMGRGGSFTEATDDGSKARIFISEVAAKRFLGAWVKSECYENTEIKEIPSRNRNDYEIIYRTISL